jgi:septal ring factor EnvC (AmiA/AmiB activator)
MSQQSTIEKVKDWFTFLVAVVACVSGVIFWVQSTSASNLEHIEHQISELKVEINQIQKNNNKILRVIGRLEGRLNSSN